MTRQEALDILGVSHDATEDQIKKAYRSLAMQYHPDRNPGDKDAEDKFKQVQGAYEVAARKVSQSGPERHHRGQHGGRARRQNARHVEGVVRLSFMEAVRGCVKVIQVPRGELCGDCSGMGSKGGTAHKTCHICGGSGRITHSQFGNSFFQMSMPCDACQGRGVFISELCGTCRGRGVQTSQSEVSVSIPAGTYDGMRLCVKGEGDPSPNGDRGDLYLLVDVEAHHWFSRSEDDLVCRIPITMSEAILGCKLDVPGINGVFSVNIPAGIQSGTVLRLRGQGVPDPIGGDRGDMLLHVRVETPADAQFDSRLREAAEKLAEVESARVSPQRKAFNAMVVEAGS